jgi:hypothetical protein
MLQDGTPRFRKRRIPLLGVMSAFLILAVSLLFVAAPVLADEPDTPAADEPKKTEAEAEKKETGTEPEKQDEKTSLAEQWGIEIHSVRLSAGGRIVDFRYRVTDSQKAEPVFERKTKPYLIDENSGVKLPVPRLGKVGPLRTSNKPQANRVYYTLFTNAGNVVQPGDTVTVVIGDCRVENLVVQ